MLMHTANYQITFDCNIIWMDPITSVKRAIIPKQVKNFYAAHVLYCIQGVVDCGSG